MLRMSIKVRNLSPISGSRAEKTPYLPLQPHLLMLLLAYCIALFSQSLEFELHGPQDYAVSGYMEQGCRLIESARVTPIYQCCIANYGPAN